MEEHVELNAGEATQPKQAAVPVKVVRLPPASPPSTTDVDQPLPHHTSAKAVLLVPA